MHFHMATLLDMALIGYSQALMLSLSRCLHSRLWPLPHSQHCHADLKILDCIHDASWAMEPHCEY